MVAAVVAAAVVPWHRWFPSQCSRDNSFEFELEGKLYFSVADNRPVHLELEGKLATESVREMNRREMSMVISTAQEGTFAYNVDITSVETDTEAGSD